MSEPKFELISADQIPRRRHPNIDWDKIFNAIEPGMAAVFELDKKFRIRAQQVITRRRQNGGLKDYYTYTKEDKFHIAREKDEFA